MLSMLCSAILTDTLQGTKFIYCMKLRKLTLHMKLRKPNMVLSMQYSAGTVFGLQEGLLFTTSNGTQELLMHVGASDKAYNGAVSRLSLAALKSAWHYLSSVLPDLDSATGLLRVGQASPAVVACLSARLPQSNCRVLNLSRTCTRSIILLQNIVRLWANPLVFFGGETTMMCCVISRRV